MLKEAAKRKRPGVSLCHAVQFLRELMVSEGGGDGVLSSKMNRWQSLSVEICFISPSHVVAQ